MRTWPLGYPDSPYWKVYSQYFNVGEMLDLAKQKSGHLVLLTDW